MLKKDKKGFTIIEVLIVLAIAGLIMLIVFLAVPALQRNSRNTQRKNDVSAILGATSEYISNNAGKFPGSGVFSSVFTGTNPKLGYYEDTAISWVKNVGPTAVENEDNLDSVMVQSYSKCDGNISTDNGATSRSIVVVYTIEGSGGKHVAQCQES